LSLFIHFFRENFFGSRQKFFFPADNLVAMNTLPACQFRQSLVTGTRSEKAKDMAGLGESLNGIGADLFRSYME
jgi:hypothetical protein